MYNLIKRMALRRSLLVLLLVAAGLSAQPSPQLKNGAAIPDLTFTLSGKSTSLLKEYRGKTIVLYFIHTRCPHCAESVARLNRISEEYAGRGVQTLAIAVDLEAAERVPKFAQEHRSRCPIGYIPRENAVAYLFGDKEARLSLPEMLIIDSNGVLRARERGYDKFFETEEKGLRSLLDDIACSCR
jgi:peroxiredoxin